jgi:branched-chain amino acid aminotransferase
MQTSERIVYFNGCFVPEREARLSIYDSALNFGDMAFEVTRTFHRRPFLLRGHLDRLFHSLGAMRIDPLLSVDELEQITQQTLERNLPSESDDVDWNIIHNISRGPAAGFQDAFSPDELRPTVLVSCYPLVQKMAALAAAYDTGLDLVTVAQHALPHELLDASIKNRSRWHYQLANLQARQQAAGSWPVLFDPDGYLTESTSANVFLVRDGELLTPEPRNLLPGITRGVVLSLAPGLGVACRETNLRADDITAADELFLTSTSVGLIHARTFQASPVGDGQVGPLTRRVREAFERQVGLDFAAQARAYALKVSAGAAIGRR